DCSERWCQRHHPPPAGHQFHSAESSLPARSERPRTPHSVFCHKECAQCASRMSEVFSYCYPATAEAERFAYSSRQFFSEVMSARSSSGFGSSTGDSVGCECSNPEYLVMSESRRLQSASFN